MPQKIQTGGLVLYKSKPAIVRTQTDKIDIDFEGGSKRVREKDIVPLHPGPVDKLPENGHEALMLDDARELLADEAVSFEDYVELLCGVFSPQSAWTAWQLLHEGLYFQGDMVSITSRPQEDVAEELAKREAKENEKKAWEEMLARFRQNRMIDDDRNALKEVERVALGQSEQSRILDALKITVTPANAHRMLLKVGYWDEEHNPHPGRFDVHWEENLLSVPEAVSVDRTDFTAMPAWAIDDEGSNDPDDAISVSGDRLYVHVADAAILIKPDSELDIEARQRSANLYLPDRIAPMLPHAVTEKLGLGLKDISPALTISFDVDESGELSDIKIEHSRVAVTRTSYAAADAGLNSTFAHLKKLTDRIHHRRHKAGAAFIDLPEVNVRVKNGEIKITPYQRGGSRQIVTEAMLAAGEAVSRFAQEHGILIPYATQNPPDEIRQPQSISEMFAYRRLFKPSRGTLEAAAHFGLGLPLYTRVTSPLRRYLDLVTHQQIHAWLTGQDLLDESQMTERLGAAQTGSAAIRKSERFSNQHWKLLYLQRNKDWKGSAVVAELEERKMTLVVPELALEIKQRRVAELELDQEVEVATDYVDIADLEVRFRIIA